MSIDFLYHALKYVAPVLTAVIALIALRKKTIAESGGLTKAGRWYSTFIIAAVLVAVGTQLLDDMRQARSTSEQLRRNAELLEQVIRGQYPLQNIRASYQVRLPMTLPGVDKYERHLNGSMPRVAQQLSSAAYRRANDIRAATVAPQVGVLFCQNSPLMPSPVEDPDAARLVGSLNVRVLLYRKRVQFERWPLFVVTGASALQPDVEMWFSSGDRCIDYRSRDHQLVLRDIGAATNPSQWENSGQILSVLDLRGAQMVVDVHPRRTDQLQGQMQLDEFEFFIGSLQALWLSKERFAIHQLPNGDLAYEFVFPETLEEILALQRRYGRGAG